MTHEQIEALRNQCALAEDWTACAVCNLALDKERARIVVNNVDGIPEAARDTLAKLTHETALSVCMLADRLDAPRLDELHTIAAMSSDDELLRDCVRAVNSPSTAARTAAKVRCAIVIVEVAHVVYHATAAADMESPQ